MEANIEGGSTEIYGMNELSISETRKRNRDREDHSFRVDKMSEPPATVPRTQAVLSDAEYKLQLMNRGIGIGLEETSIPFLGMTSSASSSGRSNSGSLMHFENLSEISTSPPLPAFEKVSSFNLEKLSTFQALEMDKASSSNVQNPMAFRSQSSLLGSNSSLGFSGMIPTLQNSQNSLTGLGLQSQNSLTGLSSQNSLTGFGLSSQGSGGVQSQESLPLLGLQSQDSLGRVNSLTIPFATASNSLSGINLQSQNSLNIPNSQSGLNFGASSSTLFSQSQFPSSGINMNPGAGSFLNLGLSQSIPGMNGSNISGLNSNTLLAAGYNLPGYSEFLRSSGTFEQHIDRRHIASSNNNNNRADYAPLFGTSTASQILENNSGSMRTSPIQQNSANSEVQKPIKQGHGKSKIKVTNTEKYIAWTTEQENELIKAVNEFGTSNWEMIASRIPGYRTAPQCIRHWENKLSPAIKRGQWSPEEDEALKQLVESAQLKGMGLLDIPWEEIKPRIPGRTLKQVRERWRSNLDPSIVRGDWSPQEDEIIIRMREEQGLGWAAIARALKGRTEHSVKTRHRSMQRAQKRPWTEKEDKVIRELVASGADWVVIAKELKNRTSASVEMRWKELKRL